jgi:hypothetical protein
MIGSKTPAWRNVYRHNYVTAYVHLFKDSFKPQTSPCGQYGSNYKWLLRKTSWLCFEMTRVVSLN